MSRADEIFVNVTVAMSDAEEMDNVEGKEYVDLMKRISAEALSRIEAYSAWRGLSVHNLAYIIWLEIISDIGNGHVPRTVASFSELHDYVDANCYGSLCLQFYDMLIEFCGGEENAIAFINQAQNEVDTWIKSGGLTEALDEES